MTSNELEIFKQSILDDVRVMMQTTGQVTQYIGARYVPLFAEPLDWSTENEYEPLTIVLHQGNSYTSRQFVPRGIDISNTEFWANTGNYNAQIEQYRREVAAFDGRITDNAQAIAAETARAENRENELATKHVAIIGDSYTAVDKYYFSNLVTYLPETTKIDRFAVSSTGFVRETRYGNGTNIPNRLNNLINGSTVYDLVIIYAGINDYNINATTPYSDSNQWGNITSNQVVSAIKATMDKLRSTNACAKSQIIWLPNSTMITNLKHKTEPTMDYSFWYNQIIDNVSGYKNLKVIANSITWLTFVGRIFALDAGYDSDETHPNAVGASIIASNMASIINGTFTPTKWAVNRYTGGQNGVIGDTNIKYSRNSKITFDGHTLTILDHIYSTSTINSYTGAIDLKQFVSYAPFLLYDGIIEIVNGANGYYPDFLGAEISDSEEYISGAIVIPSNKPSGGNLNFVIKQTYVIC